MYMVVRVYMRHSQLKLNMLIKLKIYIFMSSERVVVLRALIYRYIFHCLSVLNIDSKILWKFCFEFEMNFLIILGIINKNLKSTHDHVSKPFVTWEQILNQKFSQFIKTKFFFVLIYILPSRVKAKKVPHVISVKININESSSLSIQLSFFNFSI